MGRAEHQLWASQLYADVHLAAEGGWHVSVSGSCERPERAEWDVGGTAGIYGEGTADDSKRAGGNMRDLILITEGTCTDGKTHDHI